MPDRWDIIGGATCLDELLDRKTEVYRAALEGALQDGVITGREQEILGRLRRELAGRAV